ncbi:MAG TPA: hypothetical protein VJV79_04910 [Polyangiaceae bacterium]|nr:hypothetical protein [Polyangiaceae bacterium]
MELPNSKVRHGLVAAYAEVVGSLGLLSTERALVLPNGEFFPDRFTADEPSVQRMLDRLLEHAGLADMALVVRFWGESAASCGTGACGSCGPTQAEPESESVQRLLDAGEHWQVNVLPAEVGSPVALGSALCHAIALAVLRESDTPPQNLPLDLAVDLTAIALGYGVLLLEGSHIYRKSCGGPSIARATVLGPSEVALVLSLSAAVNEQSLRKVGKHLSATQSEAFSEAAAWADSNPILVQSLRSDPGRVARGQFQLREPNSWLGRWLGSKLRRAPNAQSATTIEELEAALGAGSSPRPALKPRDPKLDEIKRLVDEALSE